MIIFHKKTKNSLLIQLNCTILLAKVRRFLINIIILTCTGKTTSKSSSSEEVYYDDSTKQAKSTLESNKEVSEKDFNIAKIKIVYALDAIKNSENTEPSYGNFYGITTTQMIESLKQAYSFGYTPDETSLKVYQSNSNNVHQFIIDFLNGDKKVTVTGNLNTDTNQVQFSTVQGSFEGVQQ